jgi:hypothetical protein
VPMLRGQDILILVGLFGADSRPTIQHLADELGLDVASVHRGLVRLSEARLISEDRSVAVAQADEFLAHGLRYVFPARFRGESRGVPTAWAAPPLRELLTETEAPVPVWPHPTGDTRGIALEPVHPAVPAAALRNDRLYERLALVDALRIGDARVRQLAREELLQRATAGATL